MTLNVCKMKAPKLVHIGSVLFSVTCTVQGVFLCIYPAKYLDRDWVYTFLLFFIAASFMALFLRFKKCLRIPKWADCDMKSSLWCVWLVYSIGLMVTIAVIFDGVIKENHKETFCDKNIPGTLTVCRTKDNEIFYKGGTICGSGSNDTSCWKAKSKVIGLLKTDEFFGPNVLKVSLCATPVLMLLLLKSARAPERKDKKPKESLNATGENPEQGEDHKDEPEDPIEDDDLKELYFRATLNLFDGMEMLEELLEHGIHENVVPQKLETTILVCVCLFYTLSFLELLHLAFRCKDDKVKNDENEENRRKKNWRYTHVVNTGFQIALNLSFFTLRMIMWLDYNRDAAIFLTKNLISIVINVMPYLIGFGCVDDKSDDDEFESGSVVRDDGETSGSVGDDGDFDNGGFDDRGGGVDGGNEDES